MKDEVSCAAEFFVGLLENGRDPVPFYAVEKFRKCFADRLKKKYQNHWHPHKPNLGNAYRSITVDHKSVDPLIKGALLDASLGHVLEAKILDRLPKELSLWVDPNEVSYRIGDFGSIGVLYSKSAAEEQTSDYESGVSSVDSSPCSSPPQSPYDYRQQQQAHSIHRQCGREALFPSSPFPNCYYYAGMETTVA